MFGLIVVCLLVLIVIFIALGSLVFGSFWCFLRSCLEVDYIWIPLLLIIIVMAIDVAYIVNKYIL